MPKGSRGWDETETSWRYRLHDPDEFIDDSFRTESIDDGVSLVMAKREDDGPMVAQSVVFDKETFPERSDAEEWLGDHPDLTDEGASMIDLKNLQRYIVIPMGEVAPSDVPDLRELEGDFGSGIYPLWSDEEQSIIAFAFETAMFSEAEAQAWVQEAMDKKPAAAAWLTDIIGSVARSIGSAFAQAARRPDPKAARSFEDIRRLVDQAIYERFGRESDDGYSDGPWIVDIGENAAIVQWEGRRWAVTYSIDEDDNVLLGQLEPVDQEWVRENGTPVMLHGFSVALGDGSVAAEDEDDSLVWKEIIHPGRWHRTDTGRIVQIGIDIISEVLRSFEAGLPKYVSVPADDHHYETGGDVPPDSNRGFIKKLKLIGERLFAGFEFTDLDTAVGVANGSIADCSVYIEPDVYHPDTGEKFDWVLRHVLLTNSPLVQDLAPFGAIPASDRQGVPVLVSHYTSEEGIGMEGQDPNTQDPQQGVALSDADTALLEEARGLGLSAEEIRAMANEREATRQKARELELSRIVRALEGVDEHPGVTSVDGTRHYPVVVAAVESALREQPEGLGMSADGDGRTPVDEVVLAIVNAIPKEARMATGAEQPSGPKQNLEPQSGGTGPEQVTEEQIEEAANRW